jgi:enoyl-CoA hydratase/carnithine racemase
MTTIENTSTGAAMNASDPGLVFEALPAGAGRGVGFVRLARPRQMNALTADMCDAMLAKLLEWASDESIACVVLDGVGEKAFCSGGDVVSLVRAIRQGGPQRYVYGDRLFSAEYRLVQSIFEFPKPFVSWMHGVTMGAGLGLAVAASHRIASPDVRIAMPESRIGLFPDVGATWFLGRAPANSGPFIALAGTVLNVADALFTGLADWALPQSLRDPVYDALAAIDYDADSTVNRARVARAIDAVQESATLATIDDGELAPRLAALRRIGQAWTVEEFRTAVASESARDTWFTSALANLDAGSPTSIHVGFEYFRRMRGKSLRDALATDLTLAKAFIRAHDFPEGVRAALIDKDRRPVWSAGTLAEITPDVIEAYFAAAG